ncbi:hypothetical protein AAVH_12817 [Aphelenchoides avenae]|nr:hypothetical protein AAVH_12817 [Aphelenchus avenae]
MSAALSPAAIHRILCFLESGNRGKNAGRTPVVSRGRHLWRVSPTWSRIYSMFFEQYAPPLDYLRSLELALTLKDAFDDKDLQAIFEYGEPFAVQQCHARQQPIVPAIVEAFRQLREAPSFLHVSVSWNSALNNMAVLEVWPDVYADYLPCGVCTTVGKPKGEDKGGIEGYVIERFHVSSTHFGKRLTLELHFDLENTRTPRPATAADIDKNELHKIVIRLHDGACSDSSAREARKRKTELLTTDVASGVFAFVDRAHVGACLIANRSLSELLINLRRSLPVHHLICEFGSERIATGSLIFCGQHSVALRRFVRDPSYVDVRRFKLPSEASPASDCALIRRHLSNSYVEYFTPPEWDSRFSFRMLAALVDVNTVIGCLRLVVFDRFTTDYRSLSAVFGGGLRMDTLDIFGVIEHSFVRLIKTTDFFRQPPTIQGLRKMKLVLAERYYRSPEMRRRQAKINPPAWLDGILLLRYYAHYEVEYQSRHVYEWRAEALSRLNTIGRKLAHICEKFERGEITQTVEHFKFTAKHRFDIPLNADNMIASAAEVEGNSFRWDVYRFHNAASGAWLTACMGRPTGVCAFYIVHLVKGEVVPDATFGLTR